MDIPAIPKKVHDLAEMARKNITEVLGVEPDYTPETLPLADQYLRQLAPDATPEVRRLFCATTGCYFGEVVRRHAGARWATPLTEAEGWRVELSSCFMHFSPVGMAGEVLSRGQDPQYDGTIATLDALTDELSQVLADAVPLTEDEYYSFAGRVDVIELVVDWLVARAMAESRDGQIRLWEAQDYRDRLGR